jgi:hypothetical protein
MVSDWSASLIEFQDNPITLDDFGDASEGAQIVRRQAAIAFQRGA